MIAKKTEENTKSGITRGKLKLVKTLPRNNLLVLCSCGNMKEVSWSYFSSSAYPNCGCDRQVGAEKRMLNRVEKYQLAKSKKKAEKEVVVKETQKLDCSSCEHDVPYYKCVDGLWCLAGEVDNGEEECKSYSHRSEPNEYSKRDYIPVSYSLVK